MGLNAADFVDEHAGRVHAASAQVMMDDGLHLGDEERGAVLGVPGEVQVDLGVEVLSHEVVAGLGEGGSSRSARSPVNGAPADCHGSPTRRQRRAYTAARK